MLPKKDPEKFHRIIIDVEDKDWDKVCRIYQYLKECIHKNKGASAAALKSLDLMLDIDPDSVYVDEKFEQIRENVIAFIEKNEYDLEFPYHNHKRFVGQTVGQLLYREKNLSKRKDDFIVHVFRLLKEQSEWPVFADPKTKLSIYKLRVITAFVTIQFGFGVTEIKDPTPKQLSQSIANALSKAGIK